MSTDSFNRAQSNHDNSLPSENDPPEVPDYLILQICHEWAEDPPSWMREKAEAYWVDKWEEKRRIHPWRR